MNKLTGFIALLGLTAGKIDVQKNLATDRVVSISFRDWNQEVAELVFQADGDNFGVTRNGFDIRFPPSALEELTEAGVPFEDNTDFWIESLQSNLDDPELFCSGSDCSSKSDFYDSYQKYDAIEERVADLVGQADNAEITVIGQSFEGRDIKLIEIGNDGRKPIGFVICTIHAREWLSPMFCTHLIESLLTEGHPLLDTFTLAIVPVANPDGYVYSTERDNMWRKTRMPNAGSSCVGTDGNRNWDNNHCGIGSSTNECSQVYCGTAPFDQPEVAALSSYTIANFGRVMVALDIHSYGSYMIHPFGYTEVLPVEEDYVRMRQCAQEATEAAGQITGSSWEYGTTPQVLGYSSGGTSKDWFYGNLGIIYAYTVELRGNSFQPRPSNIKISNDEAFSLFESTMECAKRIEVDSVVSRPSPEDIVEKNKTSFSFQSFALVVAGVVSMIAYFGFLFVNNMVPKEKREEEGNVHVATL